MEKDFTFIVGDDSAVFKIQSVIEGRQIVAEIQEKEKVSIYYVLKRSLCPVGS